MRTLIATFAILLTVTFAANAQSSGEQNLGIKGGYTAEQAATLLGGSDLAVEAPQAVSFAKEVPSIGEQIQIARQEAKLSIEQLSAKTGLTAEQVQNIENGKTTPMRNMIFKFETALDATIILD